MVGRTRWGQFAQSDDFRIGTAPIARHDAGRARCSCGAGAMGRAPSIAVGAPHPGGASSGGVHISGGARRSWRRGRSRRRQEITRLFFTDSIMRSFHRLFGFSAALGLAVLIGASSGATYQPDDPDLPPPQFSVETRGPVHEAFVQRNEGKPEIGVAIGKQPPPPLPERPPEQHPTTRTWSGFPAIGHGTPTATILCGSAARFAIRLRDAAGCPAIGQILPRAGIGRRGSGPRKINAHLRYTPEPPAPLEDGPTTPPPDDNSTYIPGYWFYNEADQALRLAARFLGAMRAGQIWTNPQYSWAPGGYAFCDGYWDYPLDNRGLLYAPAYFPTPLWNNPGWFYRPSYIVALGAFFNSGFYRPGYNNFFFGNYYGNNYASLGYRPWWGSNAQPGLQPLRVAAAQQRSAIRRPAAGPLQQPHERQRTAAAVDVRATTSPDQGQGRTGTSRGDAGRAASRRPPVRWCRTRNSPAKICKSGKLRNCRSLRSNAERAAVKGSAPAGGKGGRRVRSIYRRRRHEFGPTALPPQLWISRADRRMPASAPIAGPLATPRSTLAKHRQTCPGRRRSDRSLPTQGPISTAQRLQ